MTTSHDYTEHHDEMHFKYVEHMIQLALSARKYGSYAPYSKYKVGASLFVRSENSQTGSFYVGVNVENASYGLTICAERTAIFSAIAAYEATGGGIFDMMVVVTKDGGTSCGACLQVMLEFTSDMDLIFVDEEGEIIKHATVKELLPFSFTKESFNG